MRLKRFEVLVKCFVNQDGFVKEWIEEGFIVMESLNDLKLLIKIVNGVVIELDGKLVSEFDLIDYFIVCYGINLNCVEEVMVMDLIKLVNMLCDLNVKCSEIVLLIIVMILVKIVEVVLYMNVVEMMMVMQKMCVCCMLFQQVYVINVKDNLV